MIRSIIASAVRQGFLGVLAFAAIFVVSEPSVSEAVNAASQFTITQQVNAEIAFGTPASNVAMAPNLGGVTGGTSNGVTQLTVTTNDIAGYTMTLQASSSLGMIDNASSTYYIPAYLPATANVPDYSFTVNSPLTAAFGYTVEASTSADLATIFDENGTNCNTGTTHANLYHCWLNASTTAVQIVNRTQPTPGSGATTTIKFRVTINSNPNPAIASGTYVATTTLTATAS